MAAGGSCELKAREKLDEGRMVEIAEGEPAQEALAVPTIVEDSVAVAPHDAIEPDRESSV